MNNIVEAYLMFKSNNVCKYINTLAEELRVLSKVPKQLNKLVYKYYDLFILSNREIDYGLLKEKTGLDMPNDRLILFYLLIEFDMASKTEFKNDNLFQFYNFIVNSILIFSEVEREKTVNRNLFYDNILPKVMKKYIDYISEDYVVLLDKLYNSLNKAYNVGLKKELKFKETYVSDNFEIYFSKIKKSDGLCFGKFRYKNDKLLEESKKDVGLVHTEFLYELDLVSIEMLSMKLLNLLLTFDNKKVFIKVSDEMIAKKSNLSSLVNLIELRCLKENIIIVINTGMLEKNMEKITYLIENGFKVSYFKNSGLTSYDIYKNGGYLFLTTDENYDSCLKFAKGNNLEIIFYSGNKKNIKKLNNVMYVS